MLLYQGSPEDLFLCKLLFCLFYLHMDLCTTCMPGSARSAEVLELLELGVMDGCKLKVILGIEARPPGRAEQSVYFFNSFF